MMTFPRQLGFSGQLCLGNHCFHKVALSFLLSQILNHALVI